MAALSDIRPIAVNSRAPSSSPCPAPCVASRLWSVIHGTDVAIGADWVGPPAIERHPLRVQKTTTTPTSESESRPPHPGTPVSVA